MTLDALINQILNRRATVEQWMFDAASGKRPMPTPDELRQWALHLGTPGEPPRHVRYSNVAPWECPKCGAEEGDRVDAERGRERDVPFNRCCRCGNEWEAQ
jgi:hypothetical protein